MRNDIINNITRFSFSIEKVPAELFELLEFDADSLREITSLAGSKQAVKKNYNTIELGWGVCEEGDLNKDEMEIFGEFFSSTRSRFLSIFFGIENIHPFNHHYISQCGLQDKVGLASYFRSNYKERKEQKMKYPFKNILNQILFRERFHS